MIFDKLEKVDVKDKERYLELFRELINELNSGDYNFKDIEGEDYFIINE